MGFDIQRFPDGIDEELICTSFNREHTDMLLFLLLFSKVRSVAAFSKILCKCRRVNMHFAK